MTAGTLFALLAACCLAAPAFSQTYYVATTGSNANDGSQGAPFLTITHALTTVPANTTIIVQDGNYTENIVINKNVWVMSQNGRGVTTLTGSTTSIATVDFQGTTQNAGIKGFKIIGFDRGNPGSEDAAVYLEGTTHQTLSILDNELVADGEAALLSASGVTLPNLTISGNIFSGKSYTGTSPASGGQFVVPNVPRQLIAFNPGVSNLTFTNNQITGQAGEASSGNYLATIETNVGLIQGNTFAGSTAGNSVRASLRVRGIGITVLGNTFQTIPCAGCTHVESATASINANPLTTASNTAVNSLSGIAGNNVFPAGATYLNPPGSFSAVYTSVSQATAAAGVVGGGSPVAAGVPSIAGSLTISPNVIFEGTPLSTTITAMITNNAGYNYTITNGTNSTMGMGASGNLQAVIATTAPGAFTVTVAATSGLYRSSAVTNAVTPGTPPSATGLTSTGDVTCGTNVALTASAIGDVFTFTGPKGYVFSSVFRNVGTYAVSAPNVLEPGTYTLTVKNSAGGPTATYTTTVGGAACPSGN